MLFLMNCFRLMSPRDIMHPGLPIQPTAVDSDCNPDFNTVHFWMNNTDPRFQIDDITGLISLREGEIDYDEPNNERHLYFQV